MRVFFFLFFYHAVKAKNTNCWNPVQFCSLNTIYEFVSDTDETVADLSVSWLMCDGDTW